MTSTSNPHDPQDVPIRNGADRIRPTITQCKRIGIATLQLRIPGVDGPPTYDDSFRCFVHSCSGMTSGPRKIRTAAVNFSGGNSAMSRETIQCPTQQ